MEKLQGDQLLCKKDIHNSDSASHQKLHSFTSGTIYRQVHTGSVNILINNFDQEHEMSVDFKKEHFEDIK